MANHGAGPLGQLIPGHEVRVVLHLGQQDFVAGADVGVAPAPRDQIDRMGRAGGEDDLLGRGGAIAVGRFAGGVDEGADLFPGRLVKLVDLFGQRVDAAMDVGVMVLVGVDDGVGSPAAAAGWWRRCRDRPTARRRAPSRARMGKSGRNRSGSRRLASLDSVAIVMKSSPHAHRQLAVPAGQHWQSRGTGRHCPRRANRWPPATRARTAGSISAGWASAGRRTGRACPWR